MERRPLDGPPRDGPGAPHQRDAPRGAALRRRHHLSRDGDAEAPVAQGEPPPDVAPRHAVPRSARLPRLPRHRRRRALALHHRLQVDLPRSRRARVAARLLREGRPRRPRSRGLHAHRHGRATPGRARRRAHEPQRARARPRRGDAGRRRHHRRARRRPRGPRRRARSEFVGGGGARVAPGAHRRDVELPHGGRARAPLRPRRLGPVLLGHDPRDVARRGGAVGHGRAGR